MFFVNLSIGLVAAELGVLEEGDHDDGGDQAAGRVDWAGMALLAVGPASLQYVREEGESDNWFASGLILRLAILSAICLVSLVAWELSPRNSAPVIDRRVPKDRNLAGGSLIGIAVLNTSVVNMTRFHRADLVNNSCYARAVTGP